MTDHLGNMLRRIREQREQDGWPYRVTVESVPDRSKYRTTPYYYPDSPLPGTGDDDAES